jgi:rSAM-associated Gly-rich repeat protein
MPLLNSKHLKIMKNTSLKISLPALLTLTGGILLAAIGKAEAANASVPSQSQPRLNALEARIKNVQDKMNSQPGVSFAEQSAETGSGMQTLWWRNWHNGGWGPGFWHNWRNGGGWGNGGWHNWHNWHNS